MFRVEVLNTIITANYAHAFLTNNISGQIYIVLLYVDALKMPFWKWLWCPELCIEQTLTKRVVPLFSNLCFIIISTQIPDSLILLYDFPLPSFIYLRV